MESREDGKDQTLGMNGRRCLSTKRSLFFLSRTIQLTYTLLYEPCVVFMVLDTFISML
jgi:hypothetical protein